MAEEIFYLAGSKPYGRSYGQWTVDWWKWAVSIPTYDNPVLDKTGQKSDLGQPTSYVWFLAGIFPDVDHEFPHREVTVPRDRSVLFPILNCEASYLEYPHLTKADDLLKHIDNDMKTVVKRRCSVNGLNIEPQRVPSDPLIFNLQIPEDNVLEIEGPSNTEATADGFWVFLKPLSQGCYKVDFEGSCEFGRLRSGAWYTLRV